jgi:hypothetical protein
MNQELCPKHRIWFGHSPLVCPDCEADRAAHAKRNEDRRTKQLIKREQERKGGTR